MQVSVFPYTGKSKMWIPCSKNPDWALISIPDAIKFHESQHTEWDLSPFKISCLNSVKTLCEVTETQCFWFKINFQSFKTNFRAKLLFKNVFSKFYINSCCINCNCAQYGMTYHFKSCRKMKHSELIRGAAVFNTHVLDCDNISRLLKIAAPPIYSQGV